MMHFSPSHEFWIDRVRRTLNVYNDDLMRAVAQELYRPRSRWPRPELVDRAMAMLANPASLDRRLKDLEPVGRQTLALIAHSRQPRWTVGSLVEMLVTLGQADGLAPIQALLKAGFLYPDCADMEAGNAKFRLRGFTQWLGQGGVPAVFAHPTVLERCLGEDLGIPAYPNPMTLLNPMPQDADGLDWPLRLAILWQQIAGGPLRRTQQQDFFKRDLDRLQGDSLLNAASPDALTELPDPGLFIVALAAAVGLVREHEGETQAGAFDPVWEGPTPTLLAWIFARLPALEGWNPARGWQPGVTHGNPYPSAQLLALLLLAQLPEGKWAAPAAVESWIVTRHPFWAQASAEEPQDDKPRKSASKEAPDHGIARFLLGVAYPLRLVQAAKDPDGQRVVRLSAMGRWILGFSDHPPAATPFPQTLLVQPNLEILVYRQGLTPSLIVQLTRFASWKTLGAACTLQLEPATVYRALEAGETFATIMATLERHGMKPVPPAVLDSLRTWSNKRDRISVWSSAALFEFPTPAELNDALARGLPAVRLSDRLAVVASEDQIDYKHFRLTGTRDYCLPPEKCVDVDADGVTLSIDLARSDLLLESELHRFAEPLARPGLQGRQLYQVSTASVAAGRNNGLTLPALETWFSQRSGLPLAPAARLLFTAADAAPVDLRRQLVLHVASPELADGLLQWPGTRDLIQARIGPAALVVAEANAPLLAEKMKELGMRLFHGEG